MISQIITDFINNCKSSEEEESQHSGESSEEDEESHSEEEEEGDDGDDDKPQSDSGAVAAAIAAAISNKPPSDSGAVAAAIAASISKKPEEKPKTETKEPEKPKIKTEETKGTEPKAISGDSVTYVTPQSVVYIFDKLNKTILEYQRSLENKKLREVRLAPDDNANMEVKQGDNWIKLSSANFKELYPIINDEDDEDETPPDFIKTKTASIKALKDIKDIK